MHLPTVIESLRFQDDRRDLLRSIPEPAWQDLLHLTDRAQLTLPLAVRCSEFLPEAVRTRVLQNLESNAIRYARIAETYQELAGRLNSRGIESLVLKGLTHGANYCAQPWHRPQYDIDLYCPPESTTAARDAIASLGYESAGPRGNESYDHLPSMVRPGLGQWRGDYYAPDLPMAVELHFRFWHPEWERFDLLGDLHEGDDFWRRRQTRDFGELSIPALHPADSLTYACGHVLKHLFRGGLKLCHVYELAHFLHQTSDDDEFWKEWSSLGSPAARLPEITALRLAHQWFGCRTHPVVDEYFEHLSPAIVRWFRLYGTSAATEPSHSRKDELFLHLCLVRKTSDRVHVALRRAFPKPQLPPSMGASAPGLARAVERTGLLAKRAGYHARSLSRLAGSGFRWWKAAVAAVCSSRSQTSV